MAITLSYSWVNGFTNVCMYVMIVEVKPLISVLRRDDALIYFLQAYWAVLVVICPHNVAFPMHDVHARHQFGLKICCTKWGFTEASVGHAILV